MTEPSPLRRVIDLLDAAGIRCDECALLGASLLSAKGMCSDIGALA